MVDCGSRYTKSAPVLKNNEQNYTSYSQIYQLLTVSVVITGKGHICSLDHVFKITNL